MTVVDFEESIKLYDELLAVPEHSGEVGFIQTDLWHHVEGWQDAANKFFGAMTGGYESG